MKHRKEWHPRIYLNMCIVEFILFIGATVFCKSNGYNDLEELFCYLTLISAVGILYFSQQRDDADEDWR